MKPIIVGKPSMTELFRTDRCNIGNGAVIIALRTCDVTINPAMSIENAAKLAARTVYEVMELDHNFTDEPEWVNSVTFASEEFEKTPAVKIVNNQLFFNCPPFLKTKKNINFWKKFTDNWYIMTTKAMERALFNRKDKTVREEQIIHHIASKTV